ncbi:MAG: ROK family protein [Clostridia bacterium]|nr:ROK family protein [Clostridia bacterium]
MTYYLGFDIGGTKCAVVIGDESGNVIAKTKIPTTTVHETLSNIFDIAEGYIKEYHPVSVGISCGGPLDPDRGIIMSPPNLPGWDNIEIVRMVRERFGLPAVLCNDANACALAEWRYGAGRGSNNMIFLTFGTGLGAGIIIDGRIYNGANGNAGEVGHIRLDRFGPVGYGKRGSFEGFASGGGIAQLGKTAAVEKLQSGKTTGYCKSFDELDNVTAKTIAEAADAGDETALEVYGLCADMLGYGLSILVDILNPEVIVIGSIFQRSAHLLRDRMDAVMRRECLPISYDAVKVVPAALAEDLGDKAALALAQSIIKE